MLHKNYLNLKKIAFQIHPSLIITARAPMQRSATQRRTSHRLVDLGHPYNMNVIRVEATGCDVALALLL